MAGWLSLTLIMAVAGREAAQQINVFEIMEVRSLLGLLMLSPIIFRAGGFAALKTARLPQHALVKSLTRTESALSILFWMLVVQSVAGLLPTLFVWAWPPAYLWGWLVVIAICGTFAHYCLASAMRFADATIVVPMDFLRVPLTATAGWLLYSERLDAWTVFGAALILFGNLLNLKPAEPVSSARAVNQ